MEFRLAVKDNGVGLPDNILDRGEGGLAVLGLISRNVNGTVLTTGGEESEITLTFSSPMPER